MTELEAAESNTDNIEVTSENEHTLTEAQILGINTSIVRILSKLKQYSILIAIQMDLIKKSHNIQLIMREFYQYEETKVVTEIREILDMFYVYAAHDKIVMQNINIIRGKFEHAIEFVSTHVRTLTSFMDKNYSEILDTFSDMLAVLIEHISVKPIFDPNYKIS